MVVLTSFIVVGMPIRVVVLTSFIVVGTPIRAPHLSASWKEWAESSHDPGVIASPKLKDVPEDRSDVRPHRPAGRGGIPLCPPLCEKPFCNAGLTLISLMALSIAVFSSGAST
jgi:hypothetical protein